MSRSAQRLTVRDLLRAPRTFPAAFAFHVRFPRIFLPFPPYSRVRIARSAPCLGLWSSCVLWPNVHRTDTTRGSPWDRLSFGPGLVRLRVRLFDLLDLPSLAVSIRTGAQHERRVRARHQSTSEMDAWPTSLRPKDSGPHGLSGGFDTNGERKKGGSLQGKPPLEANGKRGAYRCEKGRKGGSVDPGNTSVLACGGRMFRCYVRVFSEKPRSREVAESVFSRFGKMPRSDVARDSNAEG
eukprot:scaffold772_cov339-Pavlova_lutheri.AAC.50